ncbi:MAG TPA: hypothetical protein VKB05_13775 [Pyrinomonadaceae bacterium]|nr:hypothetical protein [Pyrinomonadaceae bacterium]
MPIGLVAALMSNTFVEDPPYIRNQRPRQIDYIGFGLMALGSRRYKSFSTRVRNSTGSHRRS